MPELPSFRKCVYCGKEDSFGNPIIEIMPPGFGSFYAHQNCAKEDLATDMRTALKQADAIKDGPSEEFKKSIINDVQDLGDCVDNECQKCMNTAHNLLPKLKKIWEVK